MIFKFKNGYSVKIEDSKGKTKEELADIAWAAVCSVKDAISLEKNIDTNTSFMPTKMKAAIDAEDQDMFDRELKFLARDLKADASDSHKNYVKIYRREVLEKILKQYEDAIKLVKKADAKFGTNNEQPVREKIETIRENWGFNTTSVGDSKSEPSKPHISVYEVEKLKKETGNESVGKNREPYSPPKPDKPKMKDADIPKYRVRVIYEIGDVSIEFVDSLEDAINFIRARIKAGRRDDNRVVEALVFDTYTDEIILSGDKDDEIKITDTKVKDIPYYDPTDYATIKSDYSVDRLKREARHPEKDDPMLGEFDEVIAEIDELIDKGSEALLEAGWSKDDARRAIAARYRELEKDLRRNKLLENARALHAKIRELEKAWDLRV